MLKSCLLKAQKPRVRTKELKGNVYFTLTGKNWLRKDSSGCCSIFSKSESLIGEPVILENWEGRFIERKSDLFYGNIWIFFWIKFKEMLCRVVFSGIFLSSNMVVVSLLFCTNEDDMTINWEVLYLPFHGEIVFKEEIQRAAETWVTLLRLRIWLP